MTGWRRAFCTSIPKDTDTKISNDTHTQSPRIASKFGFFSNPSTPRSQSRRQPEPGLGLRCRTSVATGSAAASSTPNSPKLQCNNTNIMMNQKKTSGSRLFQFSNPSSPKSPSSFSFIKSGLRLSKVSDFIRSVLRD